jgi:hypothetical protein
MTTAYKTGVQSPHEREAEFRQSDAEGDQGLAGGIEAETCG